MSDVASATDLPDVESLQAAPPPALPDVESLKAPFQPTPARVPQAVMDRLNQGSAADRISQAAASAFKGGQADSFIAGPDMLKDIQDTIGMDPNAPPSFAKGLRFFSQQLLYPMAMAGNYVNSVLHGAKEAMVAGVTQGAIEAGVEPNLAGRIGAAPGAGAEWISQDMAPWTSVGRTEIDGTSGALRDIQIGPIPHPAEAAIQAGQIATHFGLPETAATIAKLYEKGGILPAEVFHDAQRNPEVLGHLLADEPPPIYPVSDWTGGAVAEPKEGMVPLAAAEGQGKPARLPAGAPRPVAGTGPEMTRGLSESTEAVAINKGLADEFADLPTYQQVKNTDQGAMALEFLNRDPEGALAVAMGTKAAPKGLLPEAAYVAVKNKAVAEGDVETLRNLATQSTMTQQATTMGQRIQYLSNVNPENDPVVAIQRVQQARREALAAKGTDTAANENAAQQEYAPIRAAVRAPKGPDAWSKFVTSIRCAE